LPHNRAYGPHTRIAADSRGSVAVLPALTIELRRRPSTRCPASIQGSNAARSLLAFFCRKVDLVGHSVESERIRSDVPRHHIAEQVADGRLDAAVARPLLRGHSGSAPHHGSRKGRQKMVVVVESARAQASIPNVGGSEDG